jgi:hypothetical protein
MWFLLRESQPERSRPDSLFPRAMDYWQAPWLRSDITRPLLSPSLPDSSRCLLTAEM